MQKIISKIVKSPDIKTAETSKMIENTFRSVNIALVNELKMFFSLLKWTSMFTLHRIINT